MKKQERKTRAAKIAKEREENNDLEREKQEAKGISLYIYCYVYIVYHEHVMCISCAYLSDIFVTPFVQLVPRP